MWRCKSCGETTTRKPESCSKCGGFTFERTSSVDAPEPMDPSKNRTPTAGSGDESPDVDPSGKLADDPTVPSDHSGSRGNLLSPLRSLWNQVRALLRAPLGLVRRYALAILAFLLVFVGLPAAVLYLG